jgi:hypothetical protein
MAITQDFLLKNTREAIGGRSLTKEERQCAYLIGYIRTCLGEDFNDPSSFKAGGDLVLEIAARLAGETVKVLEEIGARQDEEIRQATKGALLNG